MILNGIIISSLGGSFKVAAQGETYICKAKGAFRSKGLTPYCGDNVTIEVEENAEPLIVEIKDRKNELIRPPLANLEQLVFVISTCEPAPNLLLLDKFLAVAVYKGIKPIIVFSKTDKCPADKYIDIYKDIFPCYSVDNTTGEGCEAVKTALIGKFSAFAGNSGAGKSSLLNNICPELNLETNEISKKLGRGKHTTRRVELFEFEGGYIADTPGFSTFETLKYDVIYKDKLAGCFPEFDEYIDKCKFLDCSHTAEKGCAVIEAVQNGDIKKSRHQNYVEMYKEASQLKEWEINKLKN